MYLRKKERGAENRVAKRKRTWLSGSMIILMLIVIMNWISDIEGWYYCIDIFGWMVIFCYENKKQTTFII